MSYVCSCREHYYRLEVAGRFTPHACTINSNTLVKSVLFGQFLTNQPDGEKGHIVDQAPWWGQPHLYTGENGEDARKEQIATDLTDLSVLNPAKPVVPLAWDSSRLFREIVPPSQHTGGHLAEGPLDKWMTGRWTGALSGRGGVRPLRSGFSAATAMPPEYRMVVKEHPVSLGSEVEDSIAC